MNIPPRCPLVMLLYIDIPDIQTKKYLSISARHLPILIRLIKCQYIAMYSRNLSLVIRNSILASSAYLKHYPYTLIPRKLIEIFTTGNNAPVLIIKIPHLQVTAYSFSSPHIYQMIFFSGSFVYSSLI